MNTKIRKRQKQKSTSDCDRLIALGLLAALWSLVLVSTGLWIFDQKISSMNIWQLISFFLLTQTGIFAYLVAHSR